jgi:arylsulfatase A-like enzyme
MNGMRTRVKLKAARRRSWGAAILAICCGLSVAQAAGSAARPNVVLVMCDDLGWGDVGFNGGKIIKTPHLDEMARAGMKFERFYSAAPVCSPTRGSALTGRHPYRYGIFSANTGHLPAPEMTLAELLRKQGYTTGHFGKWHVGTLTKTVKDANRGGPKGAKHYSPPQDNGFDVCFSTESKVPTWNPMVRPKGNNGKHWWDSTADAQDERPYGTRYWNEKGEAVDDNLRGDNSRIIMDRAIPFIREAAGREQSFFAIVWFHSPHLPVVAGPKYTAMYPGFSKYEQHYYGCITAMDEQVGRLRKELRTVGVAENTLLTFCSDNGPEGAEGKAPGSAGPFRGRKRSLYEGGVRVPGLLEWPARVKPGAVTDYPAVTSDYLPTILDVLGIADLEKARPIDGVSLAPLMAGLQKKRPTPIGFESRNQIAMSGQRFKLIYAPKGGKKAKIPEGDLSGVKFELYDLNEDPGEKDDVAAAHPEVVKRMAQALAKWRASCRASFEGSDH